MRSRTLREGSVGLLILFSILLFGGAALWIKGITFGKRSYQVTANFPDVNGIQLGDGVRYRGLKIGRVSNIQPEANGVKVEIEIDSADLLIPKNATVKAASSGLIGETFIDIIPESNLSPRSVKMNPLAANCNPTLILCDNSTLKGEKGITLDDLLPFTYRFSKAYGEPEFVNKVGEAVENASIAAGEVTNLTRDTSALIVELKEEIAGVSDTTQAITNTTQAITDATRAITNVANNTSTELVTTAKTYQQTAEQISRLAGNVEQLIDQNESSLAMTLGSIETTSGQLQNLVTKIDQKVDATDTQKLTANLENLTNNAAIASKNLKDISATFSTDESLVSLQQTLDSARVTFDNAQKITADLESITGDPAFLENVRDLVDGLSGLVSTTEQLEQQIKTSHLIKPMQKALEQSNSANSNFK